MLVYLSSSSQGGHENSSFLASSCPKNDKLLNPPPSNSGLLPPSQSFVGSSVPSAGCISSPTFSGSLEVRIDCITATLTAFMTSEDKVRLVGRINEFFPNVSFSPFSRGMGSGFAYYPESYSDCSGELSSGAQIGFRNCAGSSSSYVSLSRLVPFKGVSFSSGSRSFFSGYLEDYPVTVRWFGSPITVSGSDKFFCPSSDSLIGPVSSDVPSSSDSCCHVAVLPFSWVDGFDDFDIVCNISKFLGLDIHVDSGSSFDFDFSGCSSSDGLCMFSVFPQHLKYLSDAVGDTLGSSGLVPVDCRVEVPGGYLRTLPLSEQFLILSRLDEIGFKITRIDPRIRDYSNVFSPPEMQLYNDSSQITRFDVNSRYYGTSRNKKTGLMESLLGTCYLGSKKSSCVVRIYDENAKHGINATAWEAQFRREKALDCVSNLLSLLSESSGYEKARLYLANSVIACFDIIAKPPNIDTNADSIDKKSDSIVRSLVKKKTHKKKPSPDLLPKWRDFKEYVKTFFSSPKCPDFVPFPVKGSRGGHASRLRLVPSASREYEVSLSDVTFDGKKYPGQVSSIPVDSRPEVLRRRSVYTSEQLKCIDSKIRFICNQVSGSLYFLRQFFPSAVFSHFMHSVFDIGKHKYEASLTRDKNIDSSVDRLKGVAKHYLTSIVYEDFYYDCLRVPLKGILSSLRSEAESICSDVSRVPELFRSSSLELVESSVHKSYLPPLCDGDNSFSNEQIDDMLVSSSPRLYEMCDSPDEYLDVKEFLSYRYKNCPMRSTLVRGVDGERSEFASPSDRAATAAYLDSLSD